MAYQKVGQNRLFNSSSEGYQKLFGLVLSLWATISTASVRQLNSLSLNVLRIVSMKSPLVNWQVKKKLSEPQSSITNKILQTYQLL